MNYDEERSNRIFSVFLLSMIMAIIIGFVFGCIVTVYGYTMVGENYHLPDIKKLINQVQNKL